MIQLDDSTLLRDLLIPGTHDSGATEADVGFPWSNSVATQYWRIHEQLEHGIRYLDFRVAANCIKVPLDGAPCSQDGLWLWHGDIPLINYKLIRIEDAFNQVVTFLKRNPSETILMRIKKENNFGYGFDLVTALQEFIFEKGYQDFFVRPKDAKINTGIGKMRGKIFPWWDAENGDESDYGAKYSDLVDAPEHDLGKFDNLDQFEEFIRGKFEESKTVDVSKRFFHISASGHDSGIPNLAKFSDRSMNVLLSLVRDSGNYPKQGVISMDIKQDKTERADKIINLLIKKNLGL
ncbi:hypothetical protein HK099_003215 [Clydaea vesicula]|uniref:Uncharacterized protein n=1 Tax=Clydaea vesicula TaxID=447962 RepID=A0AAD5TSH5_9FUNG|nr:hypothetical protein HK099_003215 [Clydaea vesicula]